jgi:hypothetical protein
MEEAKLDWNICIFSNIDDERHHLDSKKLGENNSYARKRSWYQEIEPAT